MAGRGLQLVPAGAPELVRGDQKDRFYSSYVGSLVADVFHPLLPLRYVLRWEREFQLIAEVLATLIQITYIVSLTNCWSVYLISNYVFQQCC